MILVCGEALIDMIDNGDGTQRPTPGGGPVVRLRACTASPAVAVTSRKTLSMLTTRVRDRRRVLVADELAALKVEFDSKGGDAAPHRPAGGGGVPA